MLVPQTGRLGLRAAGIGLALLALLVHAPATPSGIAWTSSIEVAHGPAERGPWQQNESRFRYVDDGTVVLGAGGDTHIAWVDQSSKDVFFQTIDAAGKPRRTAINLSRNGQSFSWLPRIAIAPDRPESVYVLWQEIIFAGGAHGGDILLARSTDAGANFSPPQNLSASIGGDGKGRINRDIWHNGSQDLAIGRDGAVHVAWTEYDGQLWTARSRNSGADFSRPRQIAGSKARPARAPSLAWSDSHGGDGDLYIAWTVGEDPGADILFSRSSDGGESFSPAQAIETTPVYDDAPKIAVDASGVIHLAWAQSNGGPFARYRIRYARSNDRGRHFSSPVTLSEPALPGSRSAAFPYLGLDKQARVMVMWEVFPDPAGRSRGLAYALSTDSGERFSPPAMVPGSVDPHGGSNGSWQGLLMNKLAVDQGGRVAVINSAQKEGQHSRVWLIRGRLP